MCCEWGEGRGGGLHVAVEAHLRWTCVKDEGSWIGWTDWKGWMDFLRESGETLWTAEGSSWFRLMICRASWVFPEDTWHINIIISGLAQRQRIHQVKPRCSDQMNMMTALVFRKPSIIPSTLKTDTSITVMPLYWSKLYYTGRYDLIWEPNFSASLLHKYLIKKFVRRKNLYQMNTIRVSIKRCHLLNKLTRHLSVTDSRKPKHRFAASHSLCFCWNIFNLCIKKHQNCWSDGYCGYIGSTHIFWSTQCGKLTWEDA